MMNIDEWLNILKHSHSTAGIPLLVGGLALMLFGWRMWKLCVVASFGLIGAGLGAWLAGPEGEQLLYALGGGTVLGLASYWPAKYAVSLLGGVIGALVVMQSVSAMGFSASVLLIVGGTALILGTAASHLNRQYVIIIVTAFLGATLLLSGLCVWVMNMPRLWMTLQSMASGSLVVLPFLILVPTVVSAFYQLSEVRRTHAAL